jgi:predicted MFS family arabinose efflux permease
VKTYREIFSVSEFRVLFGTQCLVMASVSVGSLALGTITYSATASPVLTALAMFGGPLVQLVGSQFLLSLSDLLRPRTALLVVGCTMMVCEALQALPGLPWPWRFLLMAVPWLVMSATSGTRVALMSEILPSAAFVLGRSTMNVAVGVMQIAGYGAGGLLLLALSTTDLFLVSAGFLLRAVLWLRFGLSDRPARVTDRKVVTRTRRVNRHLLSSPVLRPLYLCLWVPNGLVVGCEALFVPLAGRHAGYLFAVTAAGMLLGDVVVGRFVPEQRRDRLVEPLRLLLAVPYLACVVVPSVPVVAALGAVASIGYSASLPLQERLLEHSDPAARGQVLGLSSVGMMVMQAVGALLGGAAGQLLGPLSSDGVVAAARGMSIMAAASVLVTVALTPGVRRSALHRTTGRPLPE